MDATTAEDDRVPAPGSDTAHRLGTLLTAVHDLGAGTDLDAVLHRIVVLACEASGARYGALGVIDEREPDRLARFITHGLTEQERAEIGDFPRGRGLLGRLIHDPRPVRLDDLTQAPDSSGFPPGHPPMRTFLGMPVRVGERVYGNLYLTEKADGQPFTVEDEQLVEGLSLVAGSVIDSLQERSVNAVQRQVMEGIWDVLRELLSEVDIEVLLPTVTAHLLDLTAAGAVAVVAVDETGRQQVLAASGADAAASLAARREALEHCLATGEQVDLTDPATPPAPDAAPRGDRTTVLPVHPRSGQVVALVVSGWRPPAGMGEAQGQDLLRAFSLQVTLVLDQVDRENDQRLLALLEDRDRIARDLHDLVIQRLFATGLQLQGASRLAVRPEVLERLQSAVTELDATIRDIRATIFELQHRPGQSSLRADLRSLITSYASTLGFTPVGQFEGPVDSALDDDLQIHLLAVLREALSNVARHAGASSTTVRVTVADDVVTCRISDDGVGVPDHIKESGLRNIRSRARARGGEVEIRNRDPHGTEVSWRVPLTPPG
ncbi:GAF domain-containing sensor histidine kinase [Ornithinicoccus hortensis]|uniref:GAF domain-containing sensor histidine kinase n=1 Tax=Ornithinicoccus hortensis TaxID=82346 RepID=UPI001478367F|nr:GAF domain-containing sensor histidine kinase [Ornithinicoccus hortensis]